MAPDPIITDWDAGKAAAFGQKVVVAGHNLHQRPMFDDAALEAVLDRYPRDQLGVFTMGDDPTDWRTWRRGSAGDLSGAALLEGARTGRIWLNLRATNRHLPEYGELDREMFGELEARTPGLKTWRHDIGLLISSPNAHVFYHLDVLPVVLWHLRGRKRMWVYPRQAPFVTDEQLERIVLKETAEQFAYDPAWDDQAELHVLDPGMMISWPQNAPHRIVNDDSLNVSLSVEYSSQEALMRANVVYANGVLRRRLRARPRLKDGLGPENLAKFGLARAVKALKLQKSTEGAPKALFRLDKSSPGTPIPF